ncbi:MAG: hypothetical protein PHF84_04455 [bacterium]|nr:hypothetical protein [bacterium]
MNKKKNTRMLYRQCSVCNKAIEVIVNNNRTYKGGYYFGKIKLPVGKGKNINAGTIKILHRTYNVVKWTGKEKEVEYWECPECYKK